MKTIVTTLCLFLGTISVYSQSYDGKGDQKVSVGYEVYGFGNGVKASYDHGLSDLFSVGGGAAAYFNNDDNDFYIYARTHLHLGIALDLPRKFDMYPGFELGYLSGEEVGVSGYLGFRFFITKKIGLFAEIGNTGVAGISINV